MRNQQDPRSPHQIAEDAKLADEFATPGTLKHFLLRRGFMPHDEAEAEAILDALILEVEELRHGSVLKGQATPPGRRGALDPRG
jgi:hypothetical protein